MSTNPTHTPPTDPGSPAALPCIVCGTDEGALMRHEGKIIPVRIDGKCLDCAQHPRRKAVTLPVPTFPVNAYRSNTAAASAAQTIPGVGYASRRGWDRQHAIRAHVGPFITALQPVPFPAPIALPADPSYDNRWSTAVPRWQPAEWADAPTTITPTIAGRSRQQEAA